MTMENISIAFRALHEYLDLIEIGPISDLSQLEVLLEESWSEFEGSQAGGMASYKLRGRLENAEWHPPILHFEIERHGGTVRGSSRAERQAWRVDIDERTTSSQIIGYRQLEPMARRLDVKPLAQEVAQLIFNREEDERLKWYGDGTVRIKIGEILPDWSAVSQTLIARRRRFRDALTEVLSDSGWDEVRANLYRPSNQ